MSTSSRSTSARSNSRGPSNTGVFTLSCAPCPRGVSTRRKATSRPPAGPRRLSEELVCPSHRLRCYAAAHHARELAGPLFVGAQLAHRHPVSAVAARRPFDHQVMVGERGDLGKMRNHEHLVAGPKSLQSKADLDGSLPADARVDLVEDQRRDTVATAPTVLTASMTRASSPPDATLARGAMG